MSRFKKKIIHLIFNNKSGGSLSHNSGSGLRSLLSLRMPIRFKIGSTLDSLCCLRLSILNKLIANSCDARDYITLSGHAWRGSKLP